MSSLSTGGSEFGLLFLLLGGALLLLMLALGGYAISIAPVSRSRRETLTRIGPLVGAFAVAAYLLFAAHRLFSGRPGIEPIVVGLLLFGLGAASWFAVRDILAGVFIKAGRICRVGDHVQIGDLKGRVEKMSLRVMSIETSQGDEAIIPYGRLVRESILRTPIIEGAALHVFQVEQANLSVSDLKRTVRQSALLCHWSNAARAPEIAGLGNGKFEVTVFALDADYAPDVEACVRRALAEITDPVASRGYGKNRSAAWGRS